MVVSVTGPPATWPFTMKSTVPAGMPLEPVTFAVSITLPPGADGFGEADRVVDETRFFQPDDPTACTNTPEIAGGALALPKYLTVIACEPAANAVVVNVADPDTMADEPSRAAPS